MAANRVTLTITLDAQQAQDEIKRLKDLSDQLKDSLKNVQERMADRTKWLPGDTEKTLSKQENALKKQIKELNKQIKDGEYMLDGVEERLKKMADYSYNNLKKLENVVKNALKNAQFNTDAYREAAEWLQKVNKEMAKRKMDINNQETVADAKKVLKKPGNYSTAEIEQSIKTLTDLQAITKHNKKEWDRLEESIQRGKEQLKAWNDAAKEAKANDRQANLTSLSTDALSEQKKYWQSMVDGAEQGSAALANYQVLLKQVVDEEQRRNKQQAGQVMSHLNASSVKEIEDAIKMTEQLRDAQTRGSAQWSAYNQQIENARKYLNDYTESAKRTQMESQLTNVANLSQKALEEQKKFWQEVVAGTEASDPKMQHYVDLLKQANDEITKRNKQQAGQVMGNLNTSSVKEIEDAIKLTEQLRDAQSRGSAQWATYNQQIENARKYLNDYTESAKRTQMESQLANVANLSQKALEEQKKYWQEVVAGTEATDPKMQHYVDMLKQANDEIIKRNKQQASSVINNLSGSSVNEIEDAIKLTEQLRDAQSRSSVQWAYYNKQIEQARKYLNDYTESAKRTQMESQLTNVANLSQKALEEQKKYWQEVVAGTDASSPMMQHYVDLLKQANDEITNRNKKQAGHVMGNLNTSSVKEIEDAIKMTEQLRDAQSRGSAQWATYNQQIENARKYLNDYTESAKRTQMESQLVNVANLSQKALEEQKKYWQEVVAGTEATDPKMQHYVSLLKQANDEITNRNRQQAGQVMSHLNASSVKEIEDAIKMTEQLRDAQTRGSRQWSAYNQQIENARKYLNDYAESAKRTQMESQLVNVANLSQKALEEQKKFWQEVVAGTEATDPKMQHYVSLLEQTNKEMERRNILRSDAVMSDLDNSSVKEIQDAIKLTEQLRDAQKAGSAEWEYFNLQIQDATAHIRKYEEAMKRTAMNDQFKQLMQLSQSALEEQRKYWQEEMRNAANNDPMLKTYTANLKAVNKELERRTELQTSDVLKNPSKYSVKEIEDAIKMTEQLRDAQSRGSVQWATYNQQIENARKYLNDYNELTKRSQMEVQMLNVSKLSQKALEEQKKFWQEVVAGTEATDPLMQRYVNLLKQANDEITNRNKQQAGQVMGNLNTSSVKEIEDAIKLTEQLRDAQSRGSAEWATYNQQIEDARKYLKDYDDQAKQTAMNSRLATLTDASTASLEEQKKYWQTMIDGADQSNPKMQQYLANLQQVNDEEERRAKNSAQDIISRVNSGWDDTIKNTEEAVKQLKEYRKQLNTTDTAGLKQVDDAIDILNGKIAQSVEGYMSLQDALNNSSESAMQNFNGTIDELEKLKKTLETLRKTNVDAGDEKGLKDIDDSLARVNTKIAEATGNIRDFDKFTSNLSSKSLAELEAAAKQLSEQLKHTAANSDEFVRRSADLRDVNERIQEINRSFREQENVISRTAKRLAAYLAASFTINEVISLTKRAIQANIELSDSFADIRKTTGLAEEEVRRLSNRISDIDTRTSMEDLHQLAVVAGQIGLRSSNDILGFVKASNQINVALNELGAEGTSTLMKLAQLTGDVNMGVEKALLSIGSAINELSANSAATAGPIVDMMSRLGGIAQQSGITTAEMAAMGATFNALNQPIEMAGTSLNKFISTLVSDTEGVAYALNMDARMLKQLIQTGQTTEAMLQVFERMKSISKESSDGLAGLYGVMGDLGSEGARMSQILSSAAGSVEFMRAQVELSRDAFVEATSVTNEYNVKNENAMALMQRIGNLIKEVFVNGSAESGIASLMRTLHSFVKAIVEGGEKATLFKSILGALVVVMYTASKGANNLVRSFKAFWRNVEGTTTATRMFNGALKALSITMKTIGIYAIATGVGMLIGYLIDLVTHTNRLTKAISESNNELAVQSNRIAFLSSQLSKENLEEKKKLQYINELNKNYGQYLGFMLKHTDSAEKLQKATALLNAELRKQSALTIETTIKDKLKDRYAEQIQGVMDSLGDTAETFSAFKEAQAAELTSLVTRLAGELEGKNIFVIRGRVKDELKVLENSDKVSAAYVESIATSVRNMQAINKQFNDEVAMYTRMSSVQLDEASKQSIEARKEMLDELKKEYDQLQAISTEGMNEEQQRDHYNRLLEKQAEYVKTSEELMKGYNEEAAKIDATRATDEQRQYLDDLKVKKEALIAQTQAVTAYSDQIKKKLNVLNDHWGKGPNLAQWRQALDEIASGADLSSESIDKLVNVYKQMQKESQKISDVNAYNEMFGTNFTSLDKAQLDIKAKAKIIKDRLAALGRGVTGDFLWGSDGTEREAKRKAKEEYQAALAAFEAYWNERETVLRQKSAEQLDTEAELNRKLERMNEEKWADQVQLYMKLLDDFYRQSTFNSSKYVGPLTNLDYFKDKDLDKLRVQLDKWGIAMEDGMKKKMTEVGVKLQQQLHKVRQEIEKLLLDNNFTEQVINQYLEAIDRLGLLYNVKTEDEQKRTREQSRLRLAVMRQFADESYNLDAASLRQRMEQQEIFAAWSKGRTAEEYEALLQMLRKYHDDAAEADRKAAERRKKIFDNSTQGVALEDAGKKLEEESGTEQEKWKRFEELDLVTGDVPRDVEIELYKQKIALSAQYIDSIKQEMEVEKLKAQQAVVNAEAELEARRTMGKDTADAEAALAAARQQYASLERQEMLMTQDARQKMTENTQHLNDLYMQSEQSKLTEMKKYTDAVVDFSEQMGEAAFGEVEDRKEAAKQLVKTLLTYLKDWAAVKLTELAMKQMFAQQSTAIEGQQVVSDLTMTGAKTAADIAAGGASATAKETGKLGFAGLAVGALISAALGALLGLAMSALNKSKSTVQSVSGAGGGKLATGMLTYASGNYPVLGNDGNVYNAKYEGSNPQTGIYGGGAHFGIFSEKKPEAIIDGDTTHKLVTDYRGLWNAILTISRHGSLPSKGMPTFATGNIEQLVASAANGQAAAQPSQEQQQLTQATLAALTQTMQRTNAVMEYLAANGVGINMYSDKGLYKQSKKASKFAERVGL